MRRFRDGDGVAWDVWTGRESWGVMVALFVSPDGGPTRRAPLPVASPEEAERHLDSLDEVGLQALLLGSSPTDLPG